MMQSNKFPSNNISFSELSDPEDHANHDQLPLNQQSLEQVNLDVLDRMYMEDYQQDDDYQEDPTII